MLLAYALPLVMAGITAVMHSSDMMAAPMTIKTSAAFLGFSFLVAVIATLRLSRISVWNVCTSLPMWFSITAFMVIMLLAFRRLFYRLPRIFLACWIGDVDHPGPYGFRPIPSRGDWHSSGVDRDITKGQQVVALDGKASIEDKLDLVVASRDDMTNQNMQLCFQPLQASVSLFCPINLIANRSPAMLIIIS